MPLLQKLRNLHNHHDQTQHQTPRVIIGLITNSDNRTASILTSLGVRVSPLHYGEERPEQSLGSEADFDIDFTVLSYDVGAEKPNGRIFAAAEEMLGTVLRREEVAGSRPSETSADAWSRVYVGDEFEKDVVGATEAGWKAVLVEREGDGKREGLEWLGGKQSAGADAGRESSIFDVFARTDAVGVGSLKELAEWLPSSKN